MKKYEAPMVELTKFDVEDVITASYSVNDLPTGKTAADVVADIQAGMGTNNDMNGVFSW